MWIVQRKMQATAFLVFNGGAYNQLRYGGEVAQFDEVVADFVIAVVIGNFFLQQFNAVRRAFEAFVSADDAYIVPHESTQLVPVVRNNHILIGVGYTGFVPFG